MSNSIKARPRTGRQTGNRSSEKPLWQTPFVWLAAAGALAVVGVAVAIALSVGGNDDDRRFDRDCVRRDHRRAAAQL